MRLNDAFFLCPPKALFSMLYSKRNWWNPCYLRRIWCFVKLDLNLQENCSSYLFIISSPAMRRLSIQAVRTEPTWQSQKGLYARETGGGGGWGCWGDEKETKTWLHFYRYRWHRDKYAKLIQTLLAPCVSLGEEKMIHYQLSFFFLFFLVNRGRYSDKTFSPKFALPLISRTLPSQALARFFHGQRAPDTFKTKITWLSA